MSLDVDQLARSVQRVSLAGPARKSLLRTPSFVEQLEDAGSISSNEDVHMSEAFHASQPDAQILEQTETKPENCVNSVSVGRSQESAHDLYTETCETSDTSLRRGGRCSLGLGQELKSLVRSLLMLSALFFFSQVVSLDGSFQICAGILAKMCFVIVPIIQISRILKLVSGILFRPAWASGTWYTSNHSRSSRFSRGHNAKGGWDISTVDKIENLPCKVMVWLFLVTTRICIVLLCIVFLAFSTMDRQNLSKAGMNDFNLLRRTVLGSNYFGLSRTHIDASVLPDCKTIPELVFEDQYTCS